MCSITLHSAFSHLHHRHRWMGGGTTRNAGLGMVSLIMNNDTVIVLGKHEQANVQTGKQEAEGTALSHRDVIESMRGNCN